MGDSVNIPNGFGLATLRWTWLPAGKEFTVTTGYKDRDGSDDPPTAANNWRNTMVAVGAPAEAAHMTVNWRFEGVTVLQRLSNGLLQTGANLTAVTGTAAAQTALAPVYNTWVVQKKTAYAGRQYRGRMYPPFTVLVEGNIDYNGVIDVGAVSGELARWEFVRTAPSIALFPPYVLHTTALVTPLPTAVTAYGVNNVVGIQRRRRARA